MKIKRFLFVNSKIPQTKYISNLLQRRISPFFCLRVGDGYLLWKNTYSTVVTFGQAVDVPACKTKDFAPIGTRGRCVHLRSVLLNTVPCAISKAGWWSACLPFVKRRPEGCRFASESLDNQTKRQTQTFFLEFCRYLKTIHYYSNESFLIS